MEEYEMLALIAFLILSYWTMGYIFYRIGRKVERALSYNLQTTITNLIIEKGKLKIELDDAEQTIKLLREANEQMYAEGRKDVIKDTVKEMMSDHEQLNFEKLPQKKSIRGEGGKEDANNILNRAGTSVHILLDDLHGS